MDVLRRTDAEHIDRSPTDSDCCTDPTARPGGDGSTLGSHDTHV
ncbi:hypothetical protein [Halapricum hydrolyticum]|uniref:Uncharacterized protein n=1 Tax=Halapricum hydrolyticum TaxID=2979991 RepID=A0AAE3LEY9_9EURY|nr:hypothetical protein [Halapricum hydrolyticum]MCU4717526.1 hypothetical protein [Halapricum hydrolyticum]MCU4726690.1 hypothetical protein [Halapricum hydrolyticum]